MPKVIGIDPGLADTGVGIVTGDGFHTDAFNSSYWNFEKCLQWAQENGVRFIECGLIDGAVRSHRTCET